MAAKKKLLIVESPAKAKTIKKILGKDFTVKASVGHIRDLSSKGRGKKALGIDTENGYKPDYVIIKGKEKTVKELQDAAAKADEVYLAPDPDREGEAIAWHLKELIGLSDEEAHRVTYSSITKKAVQQALENPRKIDMNRVNAQQGRRILDRLVGFSLSPFLWKKVAKNLSAGRVQSVAVRIVVEREREIKAFDPEEFWRIKAQVSPENKKKDQFDAQLVRWKGKKFELGNPVAQTESSARELAEHIQNNPLKVQKIETREARGKTSPPFITSTLQQAASTALSFGTSKTMSVAQKLYEGMEIDGETQGLITYMRTDSTRIAPEALEEVRKYIAENFDPEYLPEKPQMYSSSKNAQDAHEAIRPSSVELTPEKVQPFLTREQYRLYELIWRRFVASQMPPARYDVTTVTIASGDGELEAKGRITRFKGYTILVPEGKNPKKEAGKYQNLPDVKKEDLLDLLDLDVSQNFTKPPARFSEASLVKALEKEGIGRPSTYAPIIKTIRDRGYVRLESRYFHASELGMAVVDILVDNFDNIMDLKFTAGMESDLDLVESGETDWIKLVDDFYRPFEERLEKAGKEAEALKGRPWDGEEKCPLCGSNLLVRYSVNGAFLGCEKYPECKGLIPMPGEKGADEQPEVAVDCPSCKSPMIMKTSRYGKKFLACTKYPECKTTMSVDKEGNPVALPKVERDCDECGKPMEVKMGRSGPFLACTGYPDCKNTMPLDKNGKPVVLPKVEGEVCEKCGKPMVVKMGRRGPFLACTGFPKCRNAKPLPGEEDKKEKKEVKEDAEAKE